MFCVEEKLSCFSFRAVDYSIGIYNRNYFHVKDHSEFLDCVESSINTFGCTTRLQKLFDQCQKLRYNNLFCYMVERLCEMYFEEEISSEIEFAEKIGYDIYCADDNAEVRDFFELFADANNQIDDVYIDDDGRIFERRSDRLIGQA